MSTEARDIDILLYGVTGWTGLHLAEYFVRHYPLTSTDIRWAFAARSPSKLNATVARLKLEFPQHASWIDRVPLVIVDATNESQVDEAVKRSKVVASVVGPFFWYGEPVVRACVEHGTHYCDIGGEVHWMAKMISKYHERAAQKGVMLVPASGYDSVPSDLGTWMVQQYIEKELGETIVNARAYATGYSPNNRGIGEDGARPGGGTLTSMCHGLSEIKLRNLANPYQLADANLATAEAGRPPRPDDGSIPPLLPWREPRLPGKEWTCHFVMAWINEQVVRRSQHLLGSRPYSYHESIAVSNPIYAILISVGTLTFLLLLQFSLVRSLFLKVAPKPSSTPKPIPTPYKPGHFEHKIIGQTSSGKSVIGTVIGSDEGAYSETSKMLGESAIVLLKDVERVRKQSGIAGGFVTPAVLGRPLLERLKNQQMVWDVKVKEQ